MKCSNCYAILVSTYRCRYCPNHFCSLSCLDYHCSKSHPENNITMMNIPQINSPYLIYGIINNSIIYDSFYSLKNFVPIYDEYGKVKIIGSGSYGQVYLALHTINKKYYAIKHMDKKKLYSLLHSLSSIQKEIDIQSKIDHPNIVKLLFVKETNISYDLIMEYASDGSLFHYIRKFKGLNENKTFSLFIQVVNAVNFLHQNDLIHRDIKPENILMYENNVVRLCDFGWCVKLDGHQRGTFCGTTEYMSPELVNHEGYGKEIDVWSLGVLLYEMIHGYSPFRPNKPKFNEKDVMENIKNHNLIFGRRVSDECKSLIYHLLDPNINKRYKVEDIYNSEFVKKYELMHYNYPDNNLVMKYNKYLKQNNNNNNDNANNINEKNENENIDINNINDINSANNNIIYSKFEPEIGEKTNDIIASIDNIIYSNNNNNHIEENKNDIYSKYFESNNNNNKRNLSPTPLNRGVYSNFLNSLDNNYSQIYNENINNNNYINNDIYAFIENNNIHNHNLRNRENKLATNKTIDNYYSINVDKNHEKNIIELYSAHNNDAFHEDTKRDNKQFINFNNNKFLFFSGQNQDNKNDNISQIRNNNDIWDIQNNIQQVNNIIETQSQYNIEEPQKNVTNLNTEEIANKLISNISSNNNGQNIDNNVNYNYYYNFNNYNNNYTNNFFNNSYSPLTNPVTFTKKIPSANNSISNNNNSISINNNYIIDKNKTPSTIPTTSNKNIQDNKIQNMRENIINKNNLINYEKQSRKVSEFEIGEEIYNLSEKEQNESESTTIKINVNKEQQKINNRKYLSKSDYLIINKRKKEMQKNLENKRMNNNNTVNNTFSSNNNKNWRNYNRMINKTEDIINLKHSSIQNKISSIDIKKILNEEENDNKKKNLSKEEKMKILDENKDNIKIHEIKMVNMSMNPPNNKEVPNSPKYSNKKINSNVNNIITKQIKSKSYCGKNNNNIVVEINDTNKNNKKVMEKIYKEKKDYIKMIKEGNSNNKNKNVIIIKKDNDDSKGNNSIGDVLCSIFHAFDSKHEVHEINVIKKDENINNKNLKEELNQKNISFVEINGKKNQRKGNSKIEINVNKGKGLTPNLTSNKSSFIRIAHRNNNNCNTQTHNSPKVMNLGSRLHLENSHSTTNINKHFKLNNQANTQPNSFVKSTININSKYNTNTNSNTTINSNLYNELKKEAYQNQKLLKPSTSSSNINNKNEKLKLHLNDKIENNKNYLIKEIPINVRNRNKVNKSDSNIDNFSDLCDSKIITPKKGNIFNRINPIKLLGAFKKELNNISKRERALYSKEKKEKK